MTIPEQQPDTRGFLDWMFRSRTTGRVTLGQRPNALLLVWLVATGGSVLARSWGLAHDVLNVLAVVALGLWALDEVLRGVNPFRRLLGVAVLALLVLAQLRRQ